MLLHTGSKMVKSNNGLLTTILANDEEKVQYALEGSVFMGGAIVQWLRDEMQMIKSSSDIGRIAREVSDTGGVYLVPAFTGLGAPYWDMYARGTIVGMTRGTNRKHIIRAAEESIAYQCRDVLEALEQDAAIQIAGLKVDGGAAQDEFLMQFQADILNVPLERPKMQEITAWGAAMLAGLAAGCWKSKDEIIEFEKDNTIYTPEFPDEKRLMLYNDWKRAVEHAKNWSIK